MPRKAQKCLYVCRRRAEKKSMKWCARQSPPAEPPTMNHKTTVLCTDMDFRTSMATFGNSSTQKLMLIIHRHLHVVAHVHFRALGHRAAVRIGQRYLVFPTALHRFLEPCITPLPLMQLPDSLS